MIISVFSVLCLKAEITRSKLQIQGKKVYYSLLFLKIFLTQKIKSVEMGTDALNYNLMEPLLFDSLCTSFTYHSLDCACQARVTLLHFGRYKYCIRDSEFGDTGYLRKSVDI